jgi:predicted metal-dependent phosphoesterase TrpH
MQASKVVFQNPQHDLLTQDGLTAVDMHNHSCYSDTTTKLNIIAKKARKLGIGFSLSDHNVVAGNIALAKQNPHLFVVPGVEITTKEMAHVLTYFYSHDEMQDFFNKHLQNKLGGNPHTATSVSVADLVDLGKDYNCVFAPAHPFAFPRRFSFFSAMQRGFVDKAVLDSLDAVEVICGANMRMMNKKATMWAGDLDKATIGGSDSHTISTLGNVVTVGQGSTVAEFLDSIKKKQTSVVGTEDKFHQRPVPLAKIASQHLKYWKPTMKTQYELAVKKPMVNAKIALKKKLGVEGREKHKGKISTGMNSFAEELHFNGFPKIKLRKVAMRWEKV